jgi:succinoglycan biosynthesis protein ExoA
MPCLDEAPYIEACLRSVLGQDYPVELVEIVVADGGSTDGTRDVVARVAAADRRLRLVENPGRVQAAGMNEAIRLARGDVIVRMDVHCEYQADYVRRCVETLERTGADNVGGAQRPRARSPFQRALCAALDSPLGVGGARYRRADQDGFVDTVFLGAYPRRVFEEVGLYDPGAVTNEDAELNLRIRAAGGRVYLSREIVVHYFPRDSFRALARQYYRYGRGRARTVLKHRSVTLRHALPGIAVVAAALLVAIPSLRPLAPLALGAVAAVTGVEAMRVGWKHGPTLIPIVCGIFPVIIASHGVGLLAGLAHYAIRPDWGPADRLSPRTGMVQ